MQLFVFVILFIVHVFNVLGIGDDLDLYLFPSNTEGAHCLDGTSAGYYYQKASENDDLWVIYLQGGGACWSYLTCKERTNTNGGSSKNWDKKKDGKESYSSDKSKNPDFYQGHHVYIPYCSGDTHTGQRKYPSTETWGFYFSGHLIIENVINDLISKYALNKAKYVLINGVSAGGMGTIDNLDFIASMLPSNITIKGAPIAGWMFAGNCTDEQNEIWAPPNDFPHWIEGKQGGIGHNDTINVLWDSYYNSNCVNAYKLNNDTNDTWHCGSANNVYQYIQTPILIIENQFDCQKILCEMRMPSVKTPETKNYVEYFGIDNLRSMVNQVKVNKNGLFLASCFDHGNGIEYGPQESSTKINGYDVTQVLGDWFWERNEISHFLIDDCNSTQPCNPTCNNDITICNGIHCDVG